MNTRLTNPGVSILIFTLLMSSFLLVCMGAWKTTTYLVDFGLQKQVYIQKQYVTEGIMRWVCAWIASGWDELASRIERQEKINYVLDDIPSTIEHLKPFKARITIQKDTPDTCHIEITLIRDNISLCNGQCSITCQVVESGESNRISFWVHHWHIGL